MPHPKVVVPKDRDGDEAEVLGQRGGDGGCRRGRRLRPTTLAVRENARGLSRSAKQRQG